LEAVRTSTVEKPLNEGESNAPTLQIRSPYFIAALVLDEDRERVVRADRELDFMVGWTMEKVMSRVHVENWEWKVIEG
jgi:hypothetical protein